MLKTHPLFSFIVLQYSHRRVPCTHPGQYPVLTPAGTLYSQRPVPCTHPGRYPVSAKNLVVVQDPKYRHGGRRRYPGNVKQKSVLYQYFCGTNNTSILDLWVSKPGWIPRLWSVVCMQWILRFTSGATPVDLLASDLYTYKESLSFYRNLFSCDERKHFLGRITITLC